MRLPDGPFGAILADPPWSFRTWSGRKGAPHRTANDHYQTMDMQAITDLPVRDIAARDCALFMWTISSHIDAALDVGRAWSFKQKSIAFVWCKTREHRTLPGLDLDPLTRIGMGYWTRQGAEICLLMTRGKPACRDHGVRQMIFEPRRQHSRKPDCTHERIERLIEGPYLELFARQRRRGWTTWGNEVTKFEGTE